MIVHIEKMTIHHLMQRSFALYPSLPCLAFFDEKPITYAELQKRMNALSTKLASLGVEPGDRIGLLGDNCPNWTIAYLAITTMAAVAVPASRRLEWWRKSRRVKDDMPVGSCC